MSSSLTPNQYLYLSQRKAQKQGKDIQQVVNLYSFDAIYRDYHFDEQLKLLNAVCDVVGHVAIHSAKLTDHMKRKYKENRVKLSRNTFYLFPRQEIPADVFYKVVQPSLDERKQA